MAPTILQAALVGLAASSVLADPAVTLGRSRVTYRGTTAGSVEHFQNIRFAHDTSGQRRFAPPEPYTPPEGTEVDASAPGPACPQSKPGLPPFFVETPDISEDCLNLRVSRPAGTTADDKLPVVVHLHGGGVVKGSAYDPHFDPGNLITLSTSLDKPIIYVALNYRITIFGFARLPILKEQRSMNVGMRDQRAGLQWVKDNIAAFGGDPERITAFGLSAGGTFTSLHLISYGGEKAVPFTQAWAMSGPPGTAFNMTSDVTELHTRAVAERLGCAKNDDVETLECLRAVPFETLTQTAMEYAVSNHPPAGLFTFIPSVDGDLIPDRQTALYKAGKFVKGIPLVYGWTQDDGAMNAGPAPLYETEESMKPPIQGIAHALTDDDYKKLFSLYAASDFADEAANYQARKGEADPVAPVHYFRVSRILRDMLFTCSSIDFGREMSRRGKALDPNFAGIHLYMLNQSMLTPLFHGAGMPYVGTCHGSDMNYILNGVFPEGEVSEADGKLARVMAGSFINFAYTGNPGGDMDMYESRKGAVLGPWPEAFAEPGPERVDLLVVGGPLGSGTCCLTGEKGETSEGLEEMQIPVVGDGVEFGEMETQAAKERQRELEREKLLQRCKFINSLSEKLGN
ncbi:hypothetical protein C8A01DRAFT_15505 [Parachaetomium inaequale]|uniref:Carboxylesterase type B domain-containing protein n=1 Tax=Parachaetomium inaequale TaxID=2588326 RepID=A0AAN6PGM7_9PEZI|nr:hypothetical protein C8A01DRAFT_15505 [Parachaetomium inaequale]